MPQARILVIDDEPNIRETLRLALEVVGYQVETAEDGPRGLALFGDGVGWDLVLLDQRMPGMEGSEVLRHLHETNRAVPVILLTAHGSIDLTATALGSGARAFLTKPVSATTLRETVAGVLAGVRHPQAEEG